MKTFISRKIVFLASAVMLGAGAFTFTYALTTYKAGPFCYNGRTTTSTSIKSQADADSKMAAMIAQSPDNYPGACTAGTTPSTPGSP